MPAEPPDWQSWLAAFCPTSGTGKRATSSAAEDGEFATTSHRSPTRASVGQGYPGTLHVHGKRCRSRGKLRKPTHSCSQGVIFLLFWVRRTATWLRAQCKKKKNKTKHCLQTEFCNFSKRHPRSYFARDGDTKPEQSLPSPTHARSSPGRAPGSPAPRSPPAPLPAREHGRGQAATRAKGGPVNLPKA